MRRAVLVLLLMSACASHHTAAPARLPATSTSTSTSTTAVATTTTTAPGACVVPPRRAPDPMRPVYVLNVDVRPSEHRVIGDVAVTFTPDLAVDHLLFRLWANGPRLAPTHLTVGAVTVDGRATQPTMPDPTSLVVPLAAPLAPGASAKATIGYEVALPGALPDRIAQVGDSIRLGSFFPILAWEPSVGWATDAPATGFAEASTAPTADFDVHVVVPPGFDVLASGVPDASGTRWRAEAVRDVALSVGHFRISRTTAGPVAITVGVSTDIGESADAYAAKLRLRMQSYATWLGSYAWPAYTLAITPALQGGIEYPMFVMQGPSQLGRTTSHELAHEWFYGLVGDNQGRDPWLDEGLATYVELQAENTMATAVNRAGTAETRGHLSSPMTYWNDHQSAYYAGVYLQGAKALASLGPVERVDCALRIYVARNAYRIARPGDLVRAMTEVFADAPAKLAAFGVTSAP